MSANVEPQLWLDRYFQQLPLTQFRGADPLVLKIINLLLHFQDMPATGSKMVNGLTNALFPHTKLETGTE